MADGAVIVGSYSPYPFTVDGAIMVGSYAPYPFTVHGGIIVGTFGDGPFDENDLTLHNIFLVASDIAGDVQLFNVGHSDDSTPIYYELETQDLEINNRGIIKAIKDKLGVASKDASGSHIEVIPNEEDAIELEIGMGRRVNTITLPSLKGYYIKLRWSGESINKSAILEGFYLNKIESDGIHE